MVVDAGDFAVEVFAGPGGVAYMGVGVEMQADVGREGEHEIVESAGAIAAGEGVVRAGDDVAWDGGDLIADSLVCGGVVGVKGLIAVD